MKNKVISIMFLILILLWGIATVCGIKIGNFQILSVANLKKKNQKLNDEISVASKLTSIEYPANIDILEDTYDKYNIQKQKYEKISGLKGKNKKQVYETKQYDISYLWDLIGKYAKKYNLIIDMSVVNTNKEENIYDLNFKVSGEYVNISDFIKNLENNSDLFFRIHDFKMTGDSEKSLSEFVVKDIKINASTIKKVDNSDIK